jgi:hypothetical protein
MNSGILVLSIVPFAFLVSLVAVGQTAGQLVTADQLQNLVHGKTLVMSMRGELSNPHSISYWDFNANGSLCPRFAGSKPKDKCSDEGKWRLEGDMLCWELRWVGEAQGYKSVCARIRKVNDKHYEVIADKKMAPIAFYPFR